MGAEDIERYLAELGTELWIGISYQVDNRKMPKVSKTL